MNQPDRHTTLELRVNALEIKVEDQREVLNGSEQSPGLIHTVERIHQTIYGETNQDPESILFKQREMHDFKLQIKTIVAFSTAIGSAVAGIVSWVLSHFIK